MDVMEVAGNGHAPPPDAHVRDGEYVVELDVSNFVDGELSVEARGHVITVRGDHLEADGADALCLHERLVESFRLPDDVNLAGVRVTYDHGTLDIHAPRMRLERHELPIAHPSHRANPDAAPC